MYPIRSTFRKAEILECVISAEMDEMARGRHPHMHADFVPTEGVWWISSRTVHEMELTRKRKLDLFLATQESVLNVL